MPSRTRLVCSSGSPLLDTSFGGRLRGLRLLQVGTYRINYQLADGGLTIRIAAIRHRSIAYRPDPR